ncbi:MAG: MFS transporter [Halobacteriota archaeon]
MTGSSITFEHGFSDWRYTVGVVSGGHFLSHFYNIVFPPLFPLLALEFSLSNTELGLLVAATSLGSFLQMPVGALVDRIGGKRVFSLGVGLTSLGMLLGGFAPSYYVLLGCALLSGVGQSTFHPADYALLDAAVEGNNEGKSFGVHTFGGYAGFAVGPLVVGGIALGYGWREAMVVTGAFGLAYMAFSQLTLRPVHRETLDRTAQTEVSFDFRESMVGLFQPMILALTGFFAIVGLAIVGIKSFAPTLSIAIFGLPDGVANATLTAFFAATAVSVLGGGMLADRYDPYRIIVVNMVVAGSLIGAILSGVVAVTTPVIIGFFVVLGFFTGLIFPARDRLVSRLSSSDSTGKSFGLAFTGGSIGAATSPVLLGAVIDAGNPELAFGLIGGFFAVGALAVVGLSVRASRVDAQPTL